MLKYLISISKNESIDDGTVHDIRNKLKVKAYDLFRSGFKPSKGEVRFFVTAGKQRLAFETRGYKKQPKLLILQMISWYCVYLGLIEAQIHSTLPY
jgi:hypothetical protein